jgi:WD40-like Beta Propeller Repeat
VRVVDGQREGGAIPALVLTVANPPPSLSVIEAPLLAVGEPAVPIRLLGHAFRPDSTVQVGGKAIETTYRSPEELTGTIPTGLLTAAGTLPINVVTPGPGGGASLTGHLTVVNPIFPGRFIVFTSNRKQGRNHIYLLDRRGNRLDSLPEANSLTGTDAYPSISADSRFIAFQSDRQRGQYDVFLFDREKRTLDPLPEANHPTAFDGFPALSADGRFVVFESDRLGKPKIFLFDLQTRTLSELTHANEATAEDGLAAISN